jgi:hypothetical protein
MVNKLYKKRFNVLGECHNCKFHIDLADVGIYINYIGCNYLGCKNEKSDWNGCLVYYHHRCEHWKVLKKYGSPPL